MPYNYPVLMPLLEELLKKHNKLKPPKEWRQAFDGYLNSMPAYYANPLKRALQVIGRSKMGCLNDFHLSFVHLNCILLHKHSLMADPSLAFWA